MKSTKWILLVSILMSANLSFSSGAGDAGCGLGSLVIQKNSKLSQIFAMTTNGTFSSQMFGITSGTSNCSSSGIVFQEKEAQVYAESHFPSLQIEMAQGHGENLKAFAVLLGCKSEAVERFGEMTKSHFDTIFSKENTTPTELVTGVKDALSKDAFFRSSCSSVSA